MPYKNPELKKAHDREYARGWYAGHKTEKQQYRRSRKEQNRQVWRRWWARKKEQQRRRKIELGQVYKPKKVYS